MLAATAAIAFLGAACGTQRISVPTSQPALHEGAVLFQQRCSGFHTHSYAATFGSASNVFTAQFNNGPNFDVRCERPAIRVLYAIENGGFSGAIMPQNIVVGQDAKDVAMFVANYSGHKAPKVPGVVPCLHEPIGTIPQLSGAGVAAATAQASKARSQTKQSAGKVRPSHRKGGHSGNSPSTGKGQGTGSQ